MGPEQVLRAAGALALAVAATALSAGAASAAPTGTAPREPVAIIDLGPDPADATARTAVAAAVQANERLAPLADDAVTAALAGIAHDADEADLAAALARAAKAFGGLDCAATTTAAAEAVGIGAARQAAGRAVPELARAWTYTLLCADRANDVDAAMTAAARLRAVGGSADAAALLAKYPDVDYVSNRDQFEVEIRADVDGAAIWIDHARAGVSPLKTTLAAGPHVIAAAAADGRRGWAAGTAVRAQPKIAIATARHDGPLSALARRVAAWNGERPSPSELSAVMEEVHAHVAILRRGDALEAWDHLSVTGAPQQIGGANTLRRLADAPRLVALVAARARAWSDHAPDPNQVLLTETPAERAARRDGTDAPTQWWVYATITGVIGTGIALALYHSHESNTQNVELHYP